MTDLEALVIEWRDARLAIQLEIGRDPAIAKANIARYGRLSMAEAALMAHASRIWTRTPDGGYIYTRDGLFNANPDGSIGPVVVSTAPMPTTGEPK